MTENKAAAPAPQQPLLDAGAWYGMEDALKALRERVAAQMARPLLDKWLQAGDVRAGSALLGQTTVVPIPAHIWRTAPLVEKDGRVLTSHRDIGRQPGTYYLVVVRADIERMLQGLSQLPISRSNPGRPASLAKSRAGAKGGWDWEALLIEAAAWMYENQHVPSQTALIEHLRKTMNISKDGGRAPPRSRSISDRFG